jgi:hypothetical protein
MRISLAERGSADWAQSAPLVADVFQRSYGAVIQPNPDYFLTYFENDGQGGEEAVASCTVTLPERGELLCERYLDHPVEEMIARHHRIAAPPRSQILQIGSLASNRITAGTEIIKVFPLLSLCLGRSYALMTLTDRLMRLVTRLGVVLYPLAEADASRLHPAERVRWGSYYETRPVVYYGLVSEQADVLVGQSGRYQFSSVDMMLLPNRERELAHA